MAISNPRERVSAFAATSFSILETLNATAIGGPTTSTHPPSTKDEEEMRILKEREAFYATYNVWTGIRTAVTLTLFFLFTVTVILYKSKCKRHRRYELYPSLEDIPGRPVEIYDYWCQTQAGGGDNAASGSRKVEVHENYCRTFEEAANEVVGSAPIPTHLDRDSLSSYYNSFRIKSLPGSAMRLNFSRMGSYEREEAVQYATASCHSTPTRQTFSRLSKLTNKIHGFRGGSFHGRTFTSPFIKDKWRPSSGPPSLDGAMPKVEQKWPLISIIDTNSYQSLNPNGRQEYLRVPGVRLQSTCSSSDGCSLGSSSYDIPYDNTPLTLLNVPGMTGKHKPAMQTGGIDWENDQAKADWLQTIDINVIHPTPNVSPCGSVRSISDHLYEGPQCLTIPSRGRSASVVSDDYQECETRSVGSDSVFYENSTSELDSDKGKVTNSNGRIKRTQSLSVAQVHSKRKNGSQQTKRKVHSFRLPINPKAALTPMPEILQGKPLKLSDSLVPPILNNQTSVAANLNIPLGSHLSTSCERLSTHSALLSEYDNVSRQTSAGTINQGSSFEDDPVVTTYTVPVLRRCNSATTPEVSADIKSDQFKRADSEVTKVQRSDSSDIKHQTSTSSSGSDDVSESVSFHLFVPHLSVDCPSADTSRASSPSLSPTPPGSPTFGASLSVPTPSYHRSSSPSRGKGRGLIPEGRGILKRQFSQYIPSSPREKPPSPFGLPTSFEEEEENEEENQKERQKVERTLETDSHILNYDTVDTITTGLNSFLETKHQNKRSKEYYNKFPNQNETKF